MTKTSHWTALQNPVFRRLWGASLLSGICVAAHDTAATWVMNTLTPSPLLILFTVNAVCFLVVILALLQWKRATQQVKLPLERFFESFVTAIRYVRYAPGLQIVLARNVLFALFISVIPALMPVVGLKTLHLSPSHLGPRSRLTRSTSQCECV